jgi:hypothetical protein
VVVVTRFAERFAAAFHPTVRANCSAAISTIGDGSLAAWYADIAVARCKNDLAVHDSLRTSKIARVPARDRLFVPLSVE